MMTVIHVNGKRCCFKIVRTLRLCRICMLLSRHSLHSYTLRVCEYFGSHPQADNVPSTSVYVFPPSSSPPNVPSANVYVFPPSSSPPMCPPRMCTCFRPHPHPPCPFANVYVFPPPPSNPHHSHIMCPLNFCVYLQPSPSTFIGFNEFREFLGFPRVPWIP